MKNLVLISAVVFFLLPINSVVSAQNTDNSVTGAYRKYKDITPSIKVPTVVEVSFGDEFIERYVFAVQNKNLNQFEPYYYYQKILKLDTPVLVNSQPFYGSLSIADNDLASYSEFPSPVSGEGMVNISFQSQEPISSSAITILLDNYVALPKSVEIRAVVNGVEKTVLSKTRLEQNTTYFPKTTSSYWTVSYWYIQPLRITELKLIQEESSKNILNKVRFLAQPGNSYRIYFDPDRYVVPSVGESANFSGATGVKIISNTSTQINSTYVIADTDNDGVPDITDNCISYANSDQADVDNNARGDVCDDFDQDSLVNNKDNCPNNPNVDQRDVDGDGIGDACDGQESRITEQYPWIPWVGIGIAIAVLIGLFAVTARSSSNKQEPIV